MEFAHLLLKTVYSVGMHLFKTLHFLVFSTQFRLVPLAHFIFDLFNILYRTHFEHISIFFEFSQSFLENFNFLILIPFQFSEPLSNLLLVSLQSLALLYQPLQVRLKLRINLRHVIKLALLVLIDLLYMLLNLDEPLLILTKN